MTPGSRTTPRASIDRSGVCLSCHAGPLTREWPSLLVRSVYPDATGDPITRAGGFLVEHDTPLTNRWGGWLVTGDFAKVAHLGNAIAREVDRRIVLERAPHGVATNLARCFPADTREPARSDLVALMVLEHQVGLHNRFVEGALRVRSGPTTSRPASGSWANPSPTNPPAPPSA